MLITRDESRPLNPKTLHVHVCFFYTVSDQRIIRTDFALLTNTISTKDISTKQHLRFYSFNENVLRDYVNFAALQYFDFDYYKVKQNKKNNL